MLDTGFQDLLVHSRLQNPVRILEFNLNPKHQNEKSIFKWYKGRWRNTYLEINMNSLFCLVSLVNSNSESWNIVPGIRFSGYVEVILNILRMLLEKSLKVQKTVKSIFECFCCMEGMLEHNKPARSHTNRCWHQFHYGEGRFRLKYNWNRFQWADLQTKCSMPANGQ